MDYFHASLRAFFANNDKKLRPVRRKHYAKFALYIRGAIYYLYTYRNTRMDRFKDPWTT